MIRFNSYNNASEYIYKLGYVLAETHSNKSEAAYFYRHKYSKYKHLYLTKEVGYLNKDSMDRGLVYTLNYI